MIPLEQETFRSKTMVTKRIRETSLYYLTDSEGQRTAVVVDIDDQERTVTIYHVKHRRDVYRGL